MIIPLIDKTFKNGTIFLLSKTDDVWTKGDADVFFLIERILKDYGTVWGIVLGRLSVTIGFPKKV